MFGECDQCHHDKSLTIDHTQPGEFAYCSDCMKLINNIVIRRFAPKLYHQLQNIFQHVCNNTNLFDEDESGNLGIIINNIDQLLREINDKLPDPNNVECPS